MALKYIVTTVERERGWGARFEYDEFDTYEEAVTYRDNINAYNKPLGPDEKVPDWYMVAEQEIKLKEV